jgi:two-component system phosphate regulon response regulator OmpR
MSNIALTADESADPAHILVVDDDARLRKLLQRYLTEEGYRVTLAQDAADARAKLRGLAFDLLVVDVMMPGEDGLSLTKSLHEKSDVPVLILTARGAPADRIAGLESGADDYLAKPFEPRELSLRISTILRRQKPVRQMSDGVRMGAFRFDIDRGELRRDQQVIKLTSGEAALLRLLAAHPGATFSRQDLTERLNAGQERSVDVAVTRLRRKIESDPRMPRYLQTVRGIGYMLLPD